jgi:pilus assembly protein Flp/PilA
LAATFYNKITLLRCRESEFGKEVKTMLFAPKERGQGLVEYALILVLVAIVVIAALMVLGPIIGNVFSTINDSLSNAT